jgi:phosphoribosylanthranilate isomerase
MFRIKICGVTSAADARGAAAAGADAIGLNFFAGSRRYLPPEAAREVANAIPPGVLKVGVFVNAPADFVCSEAHRLRLDFIQLAGDETPEYMQQLGGRSLVTVCRPGSERPADVYSRLIGFLEHSERLGCLPKLVVIDSYEPGEFGGTGKTIYWPRVQSLMRLYVSLAARHVRVPPEFALAGGLNHENVLDAIQTVRPVAVDVASGVESAPGVKDPVRMRQFVSAALAGFHNYPPLQPPASGLQPPASPPSP